MGEKEIKNAEIEPTGLPEITPEMIQTTLRILESEGIVQYTEEGIYIPTEGGWKLLMEIKPVKEEIIAYGHPKITATHSTTFEITKSENIEENASCIIGVRANKACKDLKKEIKNALREAKKIEISIEAEGIKDKVIAYGSPALELSHEEDIVVRKSDFIDGRTIAILADKAACDLKRELIEKIKNPKTEIKITLEL